MRTFEMEITVPEVNGGRCVPIPESELECRIDPSTFAGAWIEEYEPTSGKQKMTLDLYQDAKAKDRLHAFTCMTIDPSIKDGKMVYKKGLPIIANFSYSQWAKMLKDYNPSRNSRVMIRTEYACRNLFIIKNLIESGYKIADAWREVCDDSKNIGHYYDVNYARNDPKNDYEPTGSSEICGFCDLGNAWKFIAEDPWEEHSWDETPAPCEEGTGFWVAGGFCKRSGSFGPVAELWYWSYKYYNYPLNGVAMLAMD